MKMVYVLIILTLSALMAVYLIRANRTVSEPKNGGNNESGAKGVGIHGFKGSNPYKEQAYNEIYNLLFCDNIELYKGKSESTLYPWSVLLAENAKTDSLNAVAHDNALEARQRKLAYNLLAAKGVSINEKELLGVIMEVAMPDGLDVLAVFKDGSARFISHAEKMLVWETRTAESDALVQQVFADSQKALAQIGKWDKERLPYPTKGMVRITFLASDGYYFGQGPFDVLQADAIGGPVINSATELMVFLTGQVK